MQRLSNVHSLNQTSALVIGDTKSGPAANCIFPIVEGFRFADISDLDVELSAPIRPPLIFSSVLVRNFDVVDIATKLSDLGYQGMYRVVAHELPFPGLIKDEVRSVAPDLDFDIVMLTDLPMARSA